MAALGHMFGGGKPEKHPNFDHLAGIVHRSFALGLAPASPEVLTVLDALTSREFLDISNAHSIEGMQELFKARSLRMAVDAETHTVTLLLMTTTAQVEEELKTEHTHVQTIHFSDHHATQPIIKSIPIATPTSVRPVSASPAAKPIPPPFEHLPSVEAVCSNLADLFVKYGQLTSADKDVLKKIKPINATVEARVVALERWQAEMKRRVRAIVVPKAATPLVLAVDIEKPPQTEKELTRRFETIVVCSSDGEGVDLGQLTRRFEAIIAWLLKLIKEFETTGVKYQNKPVWFR
jgi:hypothetical protein